MTRPAAAAAQARPWFAQLPTAVWLLLAALCGAAVPLADQLAGGMPVAMWAIPAALLALALLLTAPRQLLVAILLTRAGADGMLEALRERMGDQGMGLGAAINVAVLLIALVLVWRAPARFPRQLAAPWLALLAVVLVGIAHSPQPKEALRLTLAWATNVAILGAASYLATTPARARACLRLVVYASLLPAASACWQLASGGAGRIEGTFTHPNVLAFFLVLVISVGGYLLHTHGPGSAWRARALALYLLLLGALLLATQTRSAWLAALLLLAAYAALLRPRFLLYLAVALVLLYFAPGVQERLADLDDTPRAAVQLNSFAWRVQLWDAALDALEPRHYLFGQGLGAFRDDSAWFFSKSAGVHWDAHNIYVQLLFDLGIAGLAAYLWTQLRLLAHGAALWRRERATAFLACALILFYSLCAFSDNMLFYLSFNWYYWLVLGTLLAVPRGAP